jgi:hypothetical protein
MKESNKICVYVGTLLVVLLLILPSLYSRVHAFHNEPDGFQGIKWGTNIKDLTDMVLDEDGGDSKLYRRQGNAVSIGTAVLESCSYIFYRDMFYGVFIEFTSSSNAYAIKETLLQAHGECLPLRPGKSIETYQWSGSLVNILYEFSRPSGKGTVTYFYKPIDQMKEENEKEQVRETNSDL